MAKLAKSDARRWWAVSTNVGDFSSSGLGERGGTWQAHRLMVLPSAGRPGTETAMKGFASRGQLDPRVISQRRRPSNAAKPNPWRRERRPAANWGLGGDDASFMPAFLGFGESRVCVGLVPN